MNKLWVPYDIAVKLKEVGFNSDCIYHYKKTDNSHTTTPTFELSHPFGFNYNMLDTRISAPLYQQVFDWLRLTHGIGISINYNTNVAYEIEFRLISHNQTIGNLELSDDFYTAYNNIIINALNVIK